MTYKSIRHILDEAEADRRLLRFSPYYDADESEKRELFVSPNVHAWLCQTGGGTSREYKMNVRAFLKRYVVGEFIDNENYMKSWRSDVFELRVQLDPRGDNTRIFGGFAQPDCLVLFRHKFRRWFQGRQGAWDNVIDAAELDWAALFKQFPRIRAEPFKNCVTTNAWDKKTGELW